MGYVRDSLAADEQIRYSASLSLWRYWLTLLLGAAILLGSLSALAASFSAPHATGAPVRIALLAAAVLALLLILWPFVARKSTELVVTDRRLVAKFGLVSTHSIEIRLSKVESVRVTQGLLGKLFNYGDIVVTGTGSTFDPIPNISHPLALRNALNQAMELYSVSERAAPSQEPSPTKALQR